MMYTFYLIKTATYMYTLTCKSDSEIYPTVIHIITSSIDNIKQIITTAIVNLQPKPATYTVDS